VLMVGRATDCADLAISGDQYGEFLIDLGRAWQADHERLVVSPVREIVEAWRGAGVGLSCDLAGRAGCVQARLGVDPDGFVYNCGRGVDAGGIRLGSLRDLPLAECLDHGARRVLLDREDRLLEGRCGACAYWRFCHGGCPYEAHSESANAHRATTLCKGYLRFFRWVEGEYGPPAARATAAPSRVPTPATGEPLPGEPGLNPGTAAPVQPGRAAGLRAVKALAGRGVPVVIDRPREWSPRSLRAVARYFLRTPDLEVAIEPFFSLALMVAPGGPPSSLRAIHEGRGDPTWPARPGPATRCSTCPSWKFCRGFWMDPTPDLPRCAAWRSIHAGFVDALSGG